MMDKERQQIDRAFLRRTQEIYYFNPLVGQGVEKIAFPSNSIDGLHFIADQTEFLT